MKFTVFTYLGIWAALAAALAITTPSGLFVYHPRNIIPKEAITMRVFALPLLALIVLFAVSCSPTMPVPLSATEATALTEDLKDRSFVHFDPSSRSDKRSSVTIDFFHGLSLFGQYAEDDHAVYAWGIGSQEYSISRTGPDEYTLLFTDPIPWQELPTPCGDCIDPSGVSIAVKGLESGPVAFKVHDPDGQLPPPFPMLADWTAFGEDQYFD